MIRKSWSLLSKICLLAVKRDFLYFTKRKRPNIWLDIFVFGGNLLNRTKMCDPLFNSIFLSVISLIWTQSYVLISSEILLMNNFSKITFQPFQAFIINFFIFTCQNLISIYLLKLNNSSSTCKIHLKV